MAPTDPFELVDDLIERLSSGRVTVAAALEIVERHAAEQRDRLEQVRAAGSAMEFLEAYGEVVVHDVALDAVRAFISGGPEALDEERTRALVAARALAALRRAVAAKSAEGIERAYAELQAALRSQRPEEGSPNPRAQAAPDARRRPAIGAVCPRVALVSVRIARGGERFSSEIELGYGDHTYAGRASAGGDDFAEVRCTAESVLQAVRPLLSEPVEFASVDTFTLEGCLAVLASLTRARDILVGSALIRKDLHDAVARAVLDALNRVIVLSDPAPAGIAAG